MAEGFLLFTQMAIGKGIEAASAAAASSTGQAILSGTLGSLATTRSAQAMKVEANLQFRNEKLKAEGEEVERRRRLVKAMAAQASAVGASGITSQGTPMVSLQDTIRQSELDRLTIDANLANTRTALFTKARNARRIANTSAAKTIFDSVANTAKAGG